MAVNEDPNEVRFADLPGRPEVWRDKATGAIYMVYMVPGVEPELPMIWHVPDEDLMNEYMGGKYADGDWTIDRDFDNQAQLDAAGALNFGTVDEIVLKGKNPFVGWANQFDKKKELLPWLNDPEVAAIWASAYLENRNPDEVELAGTDWFMEKTQGEQQWLSMLWSAPETAKQVQASNRLSVQALMEQSGIQDADESTINYIADQWTQGLWTDVMRNTQVALMADPQKQGQRDAGLEAVASGDAYSTTTDQLRFVETESRRWLGPVYGQMDQAQITDWAERLRNDPNAKDAFQNHLQSQRMAMMPGYENQDLTYEDIAQPWRNFATNAWGQRMDETSDTFQRMLQLNDSAEAGRMLRTEGLEQGIGKVEEDFVSSIGRSFGSQGGVRGFGA